MTAAIEVDDLIPGIPAPVRLRGACSCGGDMLYVEGTEEETRGFVAEDGVEPTISFMRSCEACGHEEFSTVSAPHLGPIITEPYVRSDPKVGRNEPCPCGSGKKYKRCCNT